VLIFACLCVFPGCQDKGAGDARKSPARDRSPPPTKLHIGKLSRNVTADHVSEIFSIYGTLVSCTLAMDPRVQLPKGFAVVEYATPEEAEKAKDYMDGAQLDGNVLQ
jgi:RNA recognition motif-containing protein